jgi:hypothetical protein
VSSRDRFRIADRAVRTMLRASRMECSTAAKGAYYGAVFAMREANAHELFAAALQCRAPTPEASHARP